MKQENTATFADANGKAKSTARSTGTKDHWLNRERRPGYRIVIRQYPECWGLVLCDQRGYVRRGIYHVELADVETASA